MKRACDLLLPDTRNENLFDSDPRGELLPWTFERCYGRLADVVLDESIAPEVHELLNAGKMVFAYGWFHYPLYTLAPLIGSIVCEAGLAFAFRRREGRLSSLLADSLSDNLLRDEDFSALVEDTQEDRKRWEIIRESTGLNIAEPHPRSAKALTDELVASFASTPSESLAADPGQRSLWKRRQASGTISSTEEQRDTR